MKEKIVITGMGAVTPIGIGVQTYWENLIHGRCGIDRISSFDASQLAVQIAAEVKDFRAEEFLPAKLIRETDAFTQYAFAAAKEALEDASDACTGSFDNDACSGSFDNGAHSGSFDNDACSGSFDNGARSGSFDNDACSGSFDIRSLTASPDRCGIVMGTAMSGIDTIASTQEILTNAVHKNVGPRFVPRILSNIAAAQIAIEYSITGPSYTVSTACASGGDAIAMGAMLLMSGEVDAVLAVGADSTLCPLVLYSLANARALSRENEHPDMACRPFDRSAKGFVMGEGGGALVLETESHAISRGAHIYAELAGWANNNDAWHVTSPPDDGARSAMCMQKALSKAGLDPADIDYINAHGTGAIKGDAAEARAMETVFGHSGPRPYISSTKASTGHMMGGGGITEAIACIKALETGIVPPTLNLTDPVCDLNFVTASDAKSDRDSGPGFDPDNSTNINNMNAAMSNAFGFGGQNSTLIFVRR